MTRDDYPEYFEFEDDYDAELGYDYQVLPLDEVEDTVTKYAGAFVYNMSAKDWLRVSYDEGEDIAPVSGTVLSSAVSIRQEDQVVAVGDLVQLDADVKPGNVSNRTVKWSSSNPDVMEVLDSGLVKVKTSGSAVITAEAADGTRSEGQCDADGSGSGGRNCSGPHEDDLCRRNCPACCYSAAGKCGE